MKVARKSILTGKITELDLPITQHQLDTWTYRGGLVQDVFPNLDPYQREFIISGITEAEWIEIFGTEITSYPNQP